MESSKARVKDAQWQLSAFLSGDVEVLPFAEEDARVAGQIRAELQAGEKRIGAYDTLIGGQCLRHGLTLVTNYMSEFSRIRDLKCVDWTK